MVIEHEISPMIPLIESKIKCQIVVSESWFRRIFHLHSRCSWFFVRVCVKASFQFYVSDLVVEIDAPKLEDLMLSHQLTASFIIKNSSSLVEADINIDFNFCLGKKFYPNDLPKRKMISNFLAGISNVRNLIIGPFTLEVIYDYSRCEPLPLFRNLSSLSVDFYDDRWEILPFFFESCPNIKSLVVESTHYPKERTSILSRPPRLLSSLEYVKIQSSLDRLEMKLVSYLLENSPILKKVTLCLEGCSRRTPYHSKTL